MGKKEKTFHRMDRIGRMGRTGSPDAQIATEYLAMTGGETAGVEHG